MTTLFRRSLACVLPLGLLALPACTSDVDDPTESASSTNADEHVAHVEQALPIGGGGAPGASSYCSIAPLHCGGKADRAFYPGCFAECTQPRTANCVPGDCFFRRPPTCTCLEPLYIP